jgi:hypothetical protein
MAPLPKMTRELATEIVKKALKEVANFPDNADIEQFTFQHFTDYHKAVFLTALKLEVNRIRGDDKYYDIILNPDSISQWPTMKECIDYVYAHSAIRTATTAPIGM